MDQQQFGERFKNVRKKIGATQSELAKRLGITPQAISLYEKGERLPDLHVFSKIISVTGVSPKYFLGLQDTMSEKNAQLNSLTGLNDEALFFITEGIDLSIFNPLFENDDDYFMIYSLFRKLAAILDGRQFRYFSRKLSLQIDPLLGSGDSDLVENFLLFDCFQSFSKLIERMVSIGRESFRLPSYVEENLDRIAQENLSKQFEEYHKQMSKLRDKYEKEATETDNGGDKFDVFRKRMDT